MSFVPVSGYAGSFIYEYSGVADGFYGYSDYAGKNNANYKNSHTPVAAEVSSSLGYAVDENTQFRLGLDAQISGGRNVEDYNHGDWGENIYGTLNLKYGEFNVGQVYNAAYQLAVGAPSVGYFRTNNSPISDFINNPNWQRNSKVTTYKTVNSTFLNTDADAPKISYTTPEMSGVKAAFSYTPDSYSEAGLLNKHSKYDNRSSYAAGLYHSVDLYYAEIESSLGYAYNRKNDNEISAGISIYRKGWTLGGSYRQNFTSSSDYALNIQTADNMPQYFDGYRRGKAYNVGLSYEIGPLKTGITYFASYADKTQNRDDILTFANRLAINKYTALYLATAYAKYKGDDVADNEGYAVIGGLELTF